MLAAEDRQPFPGLRPFGFADAPYFFGRDAQINELRRKLLTQRFIAVVGRSGDGKSSLVKAGLLPRLAGETDDAGNPLWLYDEMRPQGAPLQNLADLVDRLRSQSSGRQSELPEDVRLSRTMAIMLRSSMGLAHLLGEVMAGKDGKVLIVVDQFEELFRFDRKGAQPEDFEHAATFVELLLQASHVAEPEIHVVLTMRSDFLGDCTRFRGLPEAINDSQFLVPRLTRDERRLAIEGPIRKAGAEIEPALVQRLLNDAGDAPDLLPVLQHVLLRTWDHAKQKVDEKSPTLTLGDYEAVGEMAKALSVHADSILERLSERDRKATEQLFLALVDVDPDGRVSRRTPPPRFADLVALCDGDEDQVRRIVDAFRASDCCFLTPPYDRTIDADDVIDVSHEALIRRWDKVAEWIEQEQEDARNYRSLVDAVEAGSAVLPTQLARSRLEWWDRRQPGPTWAERFGDRYDAVKALLDRSKRNLRAERRRKLVPVVASVLVLLLGVLSFAIVKTWRALEVAEEARQRTEAALEDAERARVFAEQALSAAVEAGRRERDARYKALQEAEAAREAQRTAEAALTSLQEEVKARTAAEQAQTQAEAAARQAEQAAQWATSLRIASQAEELIGRGEVQTATQIVADLFDSSNDLPIAPEVEATAYAALITPFWPDDLPAKVEQAVKSMALDDFFAIFSNQGTRIAITSSPDTLRLWDVQSRQPIGPAMQHGGAVGGAVFNADDTRILSWSQDGTVRLWDAASGRQVAAISSTSSPVGVAEFSADGSRILALSANDTVRTWDAETGAQVGAAMKHDAPVWDAKFSANGSRILSWSEDGEVRLWDVATGRRIFSAKNDAWGGDPMLSADGQRVLAWSDADVARIWNAATGEQIASINHDSWVTGVSFSPDGSRVLSWSDDGTVRLWDAATGKQIASINHDAPVWDAKFSANGSRILSWSQGGTVRLWDVGTGKPIVPNMRHEGPVAGATLSADERRVLSWSADGTVRLWDAATGGAIAPAMRHDGAVRRAQFGADERRVLSWSEDGIVRIWDSVTGKEIARILSGEVWAEDFRITDNAIRNGACLEYVDPAGEKHEWCQNILLDPGPRMMEQSGAKEAPSTRALPQKEAAKVPKEAPTVWSSSNREARLRSTRGGELLEVVDIVSNQVVANLGLTGSARLLNVVFEEAGERLLVVYADRVDLWDLTAERADPASQSISSPVARLTRPGGVILSAAFAEAGQAVTARLHDGKVKLWPVFADTAALVGYIDGLDLGPLSDPERCQYGLLTAAECQKG